MLTPDPAALLSAVPDPRIGGHTALVDGVTTTEYQGTTTLALLQRDDPLFVPAEGRSLAPNASSIKIPVRLWINSKDQLIRASASEPYYAQTYPIRGKGGEVLSSGAQVSRTSDAVPPVTTTAQPHQQGLAQITLTLRNFGRRVITTPSASTTATYDR